MSWLEIWLLNCKCIVQDSSRGRWGQRGMFKAKAGLSLALVIAGMLDLLTTLIGIAFFGAVESNPFIAGIAQASLPAFTVIKIATTACLGFLFYKGEQMLLGIQDKATRSFRCTRIMLRGACVAAVGFLVFAVVNNLVVVASAIAL
ncbi:MAG: DUF5658 family protein [Candidatus Bathyarchaeota archaeon]|nr:DUF5658 family protein [Candidatus Bathyarchaeota archaeon]